MGTLHSEKSADNRQARVEVDLEYLRFIPYLDARTLFGQITFFTAPFENADVSRAKAMAAAADALGCYLWDAVRKPHLDPFLKYSVGDPLSSCAIRPITGICTALIRSKNGTGIVRKNGLNGSHRQADPRAH